jgi:MFS family permease
VGGDPRVCLPARRGDRERGALLAVSLIGRARLGSPLIAATVAWSVTLTVLGAWATAVGAFALLAVGGSARSVLDVCGRTVILRAAPERVRGRVFGLLEGVSMIGVALGSLLVPALVALGGPEAALAGTSIVLSAVALVAMMHLHYAERVPPRVAQTVLVVKMGA